MNGMRSMTCEKSGEVQVRGYSDDTFGVYGAVDFDHDDCASGSTREFKFIYPDGSGVLVRGRHCSHGAGWLLSVAPIDEDTSFGRAIRMVQDGYTMVANFHVEVGTRIEMRRFRHRRR